MNKNITNEQRREVAARLRDFGESGSPADAIYGGTECYDQMLVRVLRQIVGKGDLFETLADLIDRPTCRMDLTATMATDCGDVRFWECSRCGGTHEEMNGRYERCPHCGAEVRRLRQ